MLDGMLTSAKDTVIIRGSIEFDDDDAELPLADLDIQVTVDVGPEGDEDPGRTGYSGIPRFDSDPTDAVTVIDVDVESDRPPSWRRTRFQRHGVRHRIRDLEHEHCRRAGWNDHVHALP